MALRKGGFGKVDISIMSADISTTAKCIYACISCFADSNRECYPTRATLIKMTRLNPTTFDKHMRELVEKGIVTRAERKNGNLKNGYIYKLNDFKVTNCDT